MEIELREAGRRTLRSSSLERRGRFDGEIRVRSERPGIYWKLEKFVRGSEAFRSALDWRKWFGGYLIHKFARNWQQCVTGASRAGLWTNSGGGHGGTATRGARLR